MSLDTVCIADIWTVADLPYFMYFFQWNLNQHVLGKCLKINSSS